MQNYKERNIKNPPNLSSAKIKEWLLIVAFIVVVVIVDMNQR